MLYRTHNYNNFHDCMTSLDIHIGKISTCVELVILGYFNVSLLKPNNNNNNSLLTDIFNYYKLKQLVTNNTRKTSLLDIIAVTMSMF